MTGTRWAIGARLARLNPRSLDGAEGQPTTTLLPALVAGAIAAVSLALGSVLPVVSGASPGFASAPLLVVLALAPMVLVGVFAVTGRLITAVGVLAGVA